MSISLVVLELLSAEVPDFQLQEAEGYLHHSGDRWGRAFSFENWSPSYRKMIPEFGLL